MRIKQSPTAPSSGGTHSPRNKAKMHFAGINIALAKLFKAPKAKVAKAPTRLENPWLAMELKNAFYNNLRVFALSVNFDLWLSAGT